MSKNSFVNSFKFICSDCGYCEEASSRYSSVSFIDLKCPNCDSCEVERFFVGDFLDLFNREKNARQDNETSSFGRKSK